MSMNENCLCVLVVTKTAKVSVSESVSGVGLGHDHAGLGLGFGLGLPGLGLGLCLGLSGLGLFLVSDSLVLITSLDKTYVEDDFSHDDPFDHFKRCVYYPVLNAVVIRHFSLRSQIAPQQTAKFRTRIPCPLLYAL